MFKYSKITLGFALIIALVVVISAFSVLKINAVSAETERLYNHPFTVSNAAREIKSDLISAHHYMEDVVLAKDADQLEAAHALVVAHENRIFDNFRIIFDRFLGDQEKIHRLYQSFVSWRDILHEVIALKNIGQFEAAAEIIRGKDAEQVELLMTQSQELVDFAAAKAAEFRQRSEDNARQSVIVMSLLGSLVSVLTIGIAISILRSQKYSASEIKKRSHMIDQNIMMARLNTGGDIVEISNALCRYLEVWRKDVLNTPSRFFITEDNDEDLQGTISRHLETGAQWSGEIKRVNRDGIVKWAKMTALPDLDEQYQIEGYTCILQDMTSKKLSLTDNLTTLGNRRQYEETLEREINLAKRNDTNLTLAIIDIDFFKNYNDHYGHPKGDIALARAAKAVLACMRRPNDYIFRIGGEEFAVLFSTTGRDDSRIFLESMRQAVEDLNIPHEHSSVSDHLTISIGGVTKSGSSLSDAEHFYIEADKALYLAKETRNQTVMA